MKVFVYNQTDMDEKAIRAIQRIGRRFTGGIPQIRKDQINEARSDISDSFSGTGRINATYAIDALRGMEIAKAATHYASGRPMIEDIVAGKRISLGSYQ